MVVVAAALLGMGRPVLLAATSGREVLAEAQARNGFSTWQDRKSVVTLEGFDGENHTTREAEVWERTDPHGEHREVFAYRSPGELAGTRYLVVSPRHARSGGCGRPRRGGRESSAAPIQVSSATRSSS